MERWVDIAGYEGFYQISDLGNIKSLGRMSPHNLGGERFLPERILKVNPDADGYVRSVLWHPKKKPKGFAVHRLVCQAFLPNPENKKHVNHKNMIRHDNSLDNLEWCTASENNIHAFKNGRKAISGEGRHTSKLNNEDVFNILNLGKNGFPIRKLAKMFNVSTGPINAILHFKTWKSLNLEGFYANKT